jgi:hypothetical protein
LLTLLDGALLGSLPDWIPYWMDSLLDIHRSDASTVSSLGIHRFPPQDIHRTHLAAVLSSDRGHCSKPQRVGAGLL